MQTDTRYHRALDTALQLVAFVRDRPDAPEHVLVSNFVFTILAAIAWEFEQSRLPVKASEN
jgi:hypothetical protein